MNAALQTRRSPQDLPSAVSGPLAANKNFAEVIVGGLRIACLSRTQMAALMVTETFCGT